MMKKRNLILLLLIFTLSISAHDRPRFSTAGFYELPNTGREAYSMNLAWRFIKSDIEGTPYAIVSS